MRVLGYVLAAVAAVLLWQTYSKSNTPYRYVPQPPAQKPGANQWVNTVTGALGQFLGGMTGGYLALAGKGAKAVTPTGARATSYPYSTGNGTVTVLANGTPVNPNDPGYGAYQAAIAEGYPPQDAAMYLNRG